MNDDGIISAIDALPSRGKRRRATLIYQCATRKCPLLYVFSSNGRSFAHQPRYKLSDAVNQRETVAEARDKHTVDGERRWKAETFPLALADGLLSLECDHCRAKVRVETISSDTSVATRQATTIDLRHNEVR